MDKDLGLPSPDEDQVNDVMAARNKAKKRKKTSNVRRNKSVLFQISSARLDRGNSGNFSSDVLVQSEKNIFNEARKTWDLGNKLRLSAENDGEVIKALVRNIRLDKEVKDQSLVKRGRGRKRTKKKKQL